jgi:uncharacterized membrane protein
VVTSIAHSEPNPVQSRVSQGALVFFYVFTAFTIFGYATFGRHPGLLADYPQFIGFYGLAFQFFAIAHVVLGGIVLALILVERTRWVWLPAFVLLYAISLGSELMGTATGIPFGEYRYTNGLGPMWFGHVPILIPLSWFFMAIPSFAIARAAGGPDQGVASRVLFASLLLLSWDLALDPAMSYATAYWVWGHAGAYYGMPWLNLFGWYVTGIALMLGLELLRATRWITKLPTKWMAGYYGANLLLPLGMCAAAGLWGAVGATLVVLAAAGGYARLLRGWRSREEVAATHALRGA